MMMMMMVYTHQQQMKDVVCMMHSFISSIFTMTPSWHLLLK